MGELELTTDSYPGETSFLLENNFTGVTLWNVTEKALEEAGATTYYTSKVCPSDCYRFLIGDLGSDGICCGHGTGGYVLYFGDLVLSGGDFTDFAEEFFGEGCMYDV